MQIGYPYGLIPLAKPVQSGRRLPVLDFCRPLTEDTLCFSGIAVGRKRPTDEIAAHLASFPKVGPPPFNAKFHAERRQAFLSKLPPNTTVVMPGATLATRNNDVDHPFRQDSNFFYLTGFDKPDAVAIFSNVPGKPAFTLLIPYQGNERFNLFCGTPIGVEQVKMLYGADHAVAYNNDNLSRADQAMKMALAEALPEDVHPQFLPGKAASKLDPLVARLLKKVSRQAGQPLDGTIARRALEDMRLIKTPYEIALLKRACDLSARAHKAVMRRSRLSGPGKTLYEGKVQAEIESSWTKRGAVRHAYGTIAAGGERACTLHYVDNNQHTRWKELLLLDAGCEYNSYAADITRVFPSNGKFTPAQKAIYNLVLEAQKRAIRMVKPGVTLREIHMEAARHIHHGLMDLGILKGVSDKLWGEEAYQKFFPHRTSHMLGLDVHDLPIKLGDANVLDIPLQPGMVFTIEPGLYFRPDIAKQHDVDPQWHGIGVRIEDDILVTAQGHEVLSSGAPKEVNEIEALMAGK
ncbi:MAG TPA: aminopeptidase P N-terminal domain-containing protein [Coleofasciculaceae cyanobacterium]|jgi:Xaa-Pro aminopeptidase